MFSLLNRIAWILSIVLGMILCATLIGLFDSRSTMADAFISGIICGAILKAVIFSESTIRSSLAEFSSSGSLSHPIEPNYYSPVNNLSDVVQSEDSQQEQKGPTNPLEELVLAHQDGVERQNDQSWEDARIQSEQEYQEQSTSEIVPEEPSKFIRYIREFFSDRPLAKIGGILLFLGSFFFLYLIFDWAGPFGKVIMGLLFGFFLIGVGIFLDKRGITTESRVLFGVGIAVNYLTILAGHYILGMGAASESSFFSDIATTIFLLLNTGLAVVMALIYRSRVLLGFAFIFAYLTPFLVGASSQTTYLLSIYTTLITLAIAVINFFYSKMDQSENRNYLEMIGIIGMTALFSLAGIASNSMNDGMNEVIVISVGLLVSVLCLAIFAWKMKRSPMMLLVASYIVIFALVGSGGGAHTFVLLPFLIASLLLLSMAFVFVGTLSLISLSGLSVGIFFLSIIGYFVDGMTATSLITLLSVNISLFILLGVLVLRSASILLGSVVLVGMAISLLIGATALESASMDFGSLLVFKSLGIAALLGSSAFAIRTRESALFLLSLVLSGIILLYPSLSTHPAIFLIFTVIFTLVALTTPALLLQQEQTSLNKSFLIASLPVGALVLMTAIYQITSAYDIGSIAKGFVYILEAGMYLIYALVVGRKLMIPDEKNTISAPNKTTLLVLFALPLSLVTFALAFIFQESASVMSLAWMIESSILYMVYSRMQDRRILLFASVVFFIGICKYLLLIGGLHTRDYLALGTSLLAMTSVFASLYVLRRDEGNERIGYDILHIVAILAIGSGVAQIIPSTGTGWSLLGMIGFLTLVAPLYAHYGRTIHKVFLSVALVVFGLAFFAKFDGLYHDTLLQFIVQWSALALFVMVGYIGLRSKELYGYINFTTSILGFLILSSLYVNEFINTFAVSIYLTIVATFLIIRGITHENPKFRTIGLYIGTFALAKILFFDIWTEIDGSIAKVIALMVSGGLMIYLSQLYGNYVHRGWKDEFSLSQIFGFLHLTDEDITPSVNMVEEQDNFKEQEVDPFHQDLAKELKGISVAEFSGVRFVSLSGSSFINERASVIRLVRYITTLMKKESFAPGELTQIYSRVVQHLQSSMKQEALNKMLTQIDLWIREGGSIELIQK